jgi:myo-inositol-1(or 4)-monophosphatase
MVAHSGIMTMMDRAARKAGAKLRRDFYEVQQLQVSRKGPADFVSKADMRSERTIYDELSKARPDWPAASKAIRASRVLLLIR